VGGTTIARRARWAGVVAALVLAPALAPAGAAVGSPRRTDPGAATASGLSTAQRRQLAARHAFTTRPITFLLLGDSLALTFGIGLADHAVPRYGVDLNDQAVLGCDLDADLLIRGAGKVGPATPGCPHWRWFWPQLIRTERPAVVGLLLGRWYDYDHFYDGQWVHVGEPAWDAHVEGELEQAVGILSAGGARVVLFTQPYVDPPLTAGQTEPWPENDPIRTDAYNEIVRRVVAHDARHTALLIDLNRLLDPDGHFTMTIGPTRVRWLDGIHVAFAGGVLVQRSVLPTVAALGLRRPAGA